MMQENRPNVQPGHAKQDFIQACKRNPSYFESILENLATENCTESDFKEYKLLSDHQAFKLDKNDLLQISKGSSKSALSSFLFTYVFNNCGGLHEKLMYDIYNQLIEAGAFSGWSKQELLGECCRSYKPNSNILSTLLRPKAEEIGMALIESGAFSGWSKDEFSLAWSQDPEVFMEIMASSSELLEVCINRHIATLLHRAFVESGAFDFSKAEIKAMYDQNHPYAYNAYNLFLNFCDTYISELDNLSFNFLTKHHVKYQHLIQDLCKERNIYYEGYKPYSITPPLVKHNDFNMEPLFPSFSREYFSEDMYESQRPVHFDTKWVAQSAPLVWRHIGLALEVLTKKLPSFPPEIIIRIIRFDATRLGIRETELNVYLKNWPGIRLKQCIVVTAFRVTKRLFEQKLPSPTYSQTMNHHCAKHDLYRNIRDILLFCHKTKSNIPSDELIMQTEADIEKVSHYITSRLSGKIWTAHLTPRRIAKELSVILPLTAHPTQHSSEKNGYSVIKEIRDIWSNFIGWRNDAQKYFFENVLTQALEREHISAESILNGISKNNPEMLELVDYTMSDYHLDGFCTRLKKFALSSCN